ncbi:MAG: maltose ABC transporter substrate-binding protein [Spirochaetaceae bacterium]|jgi:arabinogalactan oligomer/maltooligosaccharide transport system substrate-binding protein|nr:maltose ABC transporter substrate-binding protein [Spirochaetaceae bacterium]
MKKAILLALTVFVSSVFGLYAGGQQESTVEEMPEESGKTLTFWVYDSGRIEVLTELGKKFEEEYGVTIDVALVDLSQIRNQMLLASGGAEAADLAIIPHDNLGAMVENDAVLEFNLGAKEAKYLKPAIDGFTYNGKLYGLPLAVENIGFFYNADMVDKAPKSWDEVYTEGKALVASGKAEYIMGYPDATYNVFPVYSSYGGYIFGKNASGVTTSDDIGLNKEGFVKGLEWMTKLVKEGLVPETIDWDGAHVLFESGKAPFILTGPWALNRFQTEGVNYKIAEFPSKGAPFLGVQGVIISSASENALLAQTFATEYLATEESMQAIFDAEKRPSAWKSIFENSGNPDVSGFNKAGSNANPMPSIPEMGFVWDAWVNAAALAFSGELTPEEALDNAVNQIKTQIAESK